MPLATKKEKIFLILFLSCLVVAIGAIICASVAFFQKYKMKRESENVIAYADTMVRQSQTVIDATTCVRKFNQLYMFFDDNGSNTTVPISIYYTLGGVAYGLASPSGSSSSSNKYEGMTTQICKGLTTSEIISKMKLSSYIKSSVPDSDVNSYTKMSGDYIEFIYKYPTSVKNTIRYSLDSYSYASSNSSKIQELIESNWLEAISISSVKTSCEESSSS